MLERIQDRFPWLEPVRADAGYDARQVGATVAAIPMLRLEIVRRTDDTSGFVVQPRRRVAERAAAWLGRNRRLAEDDDNLFETAAAFVILAVIQLVLRCLAKPIPF